MSHHAFAALWMQLETRTDINNILSELVGRNSLESSVLPDHSDDLLETTLGLSVILRVIFDLQRTYLQSPRPELQSLYLLQPSQLLLAIVHLLRLKSRVFYHSRDRISEHFVAQRSFIAQTLVSSLRALWLWNNPLGPNEIVQLQVAFQNAWEEDDLSARDGFLIRILCAKIINELSGRPATSSSLAFPACGHIQLRDYTTLVSILGT